MMAEAVVVAREEAQLTEILEEMGVVTRKTAERVLQRARQLERRFVQVLLDLQLATDEELAAALGRLHGCKKVNDPARLAIAPELLSVISVEVALQNLAFPLKRENGNLAVAFADPRSAQTLAAAVASQNLKIVPFVCSRGEIQEAICKHYLGKSRTQSDKRTILLVDDDQTIRAMFADILTPAGYRVVQARDGMEGFKMALSERPHVIITDREMPKIDGYTLLSALRNIPETCFLPVIMVTGRARDEEEELQAFHKGFFDVIFKPVRRASLLARVNRAFHFYDNQYRLF